MNPLEALRLLAPAVAAHYNGAARQRQSILDRLRRGPATRAQLERECHAPSVTKRLSELRRAGWQIEGEAISEAAPDGCVNVATLYSLADPDTAQGDLFTTP